MNIFGRAKSPNGQQHIQKWCDSTWPTVYRYVYSSVQNREEAEDITQETFTRALKKWSSPDELPTNSYLKTVALNLIRDRWRRSKAWGTRVPLEDYMLSANSVTDQIDIQTLMQQMLAKLPEDYQTVLQLRIIKGFSRSETAAQMKRSEDSIRGLQYRAVQALKNLADKHFEEGDKH
ncbi:MAG TPA: sigma-70 family RNA polymerase sigma factor [Desulfobacteria bacterium]|nr:sigma-70 family RNA polymerase sigma factor [Desulfobacteria bacterium]